MLKNRKKALTGPGASDKIKSLAKERAATLEAARGFSKPSDKNPTNLFHEYIHHAFLRRLERSKYADQFALKGAQMMRHVTGELFRPTTDIDFNVAPTMTSEELQKAIIEICSIAADPSDGVEFQVGKNPRIRKERDAKIKGSKVTLEATIGKTVFPLDVDIGFENYISAPMWKVVFPPMIAGEEAINVTMCPPENAIAEKFRAMVFFGKSTSRIKDFFDIQKYIETLEIDGDYIAQEVAQTLKQFEIKLPPLDEINVLDPDDISEYHQSQWRAFSEKYGAEIQEFSDCIRAIREFIGPVVSYVRNEGPSPGVWSPSDKWQEGLAIGKSRLIA